MARILILTALAAAATAARAHQGGVDVRGVVEAVAPDRIVVTTAAGNRSFAVTPATEFAKGGSPARLEDLRPGDRVVVHGRTRGGRTEAVLVKIGARDRGSGPAQASPPR